jgi:hypothetical protein
MEASTKLVQEQRLAHALKTKQQLKIVMGFSIMEGLPVVTLAKFSFYQNSNALLQLLLTSRSSLWFY